MPELRLPAHQLSPSATARKAAAVRAAAVEGLITEDSPVVGFIDLDAIAVSQAELKQAFAFTSAPVLHAFAAKAASLVPVLRLFADAGMGCEVASPGELAQALAAGFPPERVVLDSPAKTPSELREALRLGVAVNADNFTELERIDRLLRELHPLDAHDHAPALGLRINPQVGAGTIEAMSTASARSKFGVPLRDRGGREAIIAAFDRYPWLTRLHVHVGSQGCPLELIAAGIRSVYELAEEINARAAADPERRRGGRVTSIDIGGGLPVNFDDDRVSPTFAEYAEVLRDAVPGLFDGRYGLVTEFGRSLSAKNGFTLARVEYAKQVADRRIALTHAGAQVATRTVFMPESWPLRLSAYSSDGWPKLGPVCTHDVAGPCCFAGDLVATGRDLEVLDTGDLILLHDTGGYFFTAPWAYNSLPRPDVYGFRVDADGNVRFTLMRRRQTLDEIVAEAGGDPASANSRTSEHSLG
ncbi:diaminopimelate decarboxylase [Actinospica durhamensis]|uniref:diaminopimelate decarboxylase n=1 Tax=Actinospica durhamensis TaxID=1508375 RepID=UPI003F684D7A